MNKIDKLCASTHMLRVPGKGITILSDENLAEAGIALVNNRMKPLRQWWMLSAFLSAWADTGDLLIVRP